MSDLDGSVGVSESENVWREIWGEGESKEEGNGSDGERRVTTFSLLPVDVWHRYKHK